MRGWEEPIGSLEDAISDSARSVSSAPALVAVGFTTGLLVAAPADAQPIEPVDPPTSPADLPAEPGLGPIPPADDSLAPTGLSLQAREELSDAGLDRYLGSFEPVSTQELGNGWTRHTFDTEAGDGPVCISGTPYSVYTRAGQPTRLLVFLQGGGACWQDFYFCNVHAEDQPPFSEEVREGIWNFEADGNPFADHSIVYLPYCDGSLFSGDHAVSDPAFPDGDVRHHRGVRNQSAGLDLAATLFPDAEQITLAGSSAGGVGVAAFTPFLVRFLYGDEVDLGVFNDAGPVVQNPAQAPLLDVRAADWQFDRFLPESCLDCDVRDPVIPLIHWRLEHDASVRDAFYSTDADVIVRFFLGVWSQAEYRDLLLTEHGALHDADPSRYTRFIISGDTSHDTLQDASFYTREVDGVPLTLWTTLFVNTPALSPDLVEAYEPAE